MSRTAWLALVLAAPLALGCAGDDPETGETPSDSPDNPDNPDDPEGDKPDEPTDPVEPPQWSFGPVYGVANLDDDDLDTDLAPDFFQYPFEGDDDLVPLSIPWEVVSTGDVTLTLSGDTDAIRVWRDGEPVLGDSAPGMTYTFTAMAENVELVVEFGAYNARGTLDLLVESGDWVFEYSAVLASSPLIMNHHLQPSEHVYMVQVNGQGYSNAPLVAAYDSIVGPANFSVASGPSYSWDVWMQDEIEFATSVGIRGERLDVVIDSVRDRGLAPFAANELVEPGVTRGIWGDPSFASTFDAFGNLEASPPVEVDGVEYPYGRIFYGRQGNWGLQLGLADFLASQTVQEPFELDTTWLCVGHVDEFSTFIPDPSSAKGFKLLLADITAGYELLDSLPADMALPQYADHGYTTVGEMQDDVALRGLNQDLQADYLDTIRDQFKAELGLTDADIIEVPSIFEVVSRCGGGTVALIPGMANLIVADDPSGQTHLFIPDPFFRSDVDDQSGDPVIADLAAKLPESLEVVFVDDWDVYHMGLGEVHCGTNVKRTPTGNWWDLANHLLGGL